MVPTRMTSRGAGPAITTVVLYEVRPQAAATAGGYAAALAERLGAQVESAPMGDWSRADVVEATVRPRGHLVILDPVDANACETVRAALHEIACPTLIVPAGFTGFNEPLRILCGVADDAAAAGVARFGGSLSEDPAAVLSLLHAPPHGSDPVAAQRVLARCARTLSRNVTASLQIHPGRAVATLRAAARAERASILVVGRPRHPQQVGTMLGSVPHALLRHGDLPLLVVPPSIAAVPDPWTSVIPD